MNLHCHYILQLRDQIEIFRIQSSSRKKKITKSWLLLLYDRAAVPGLPIVGNLHQLKEKKPHQTFTRWAEVYGPIYTIKTGASTAVVLNSTEVAKEVS
jgi:hypothetical protein